MTKEIQDSIAYVVVDVATMERVSKFYTRRVDAKGYITNRHRYRPDWKLVIAEFEYKCYYVID